MPTFRGYMARVVPTADLKPGDRIYFTGASMLLPIAVLTRQGEETVIDGVYESWGQRRVARVRRKTAGRSTIHIPASTS